MNRQNWKRTARENLADIISMAMFIKKGIAHQTAENTKSDLECLERRVRIAIDEIGKEA